MLDKELMTKNSNLLLSKKEFDMNKALLKDLVDREEDLDSFRYD